MDQINKVINFINNFNMIQNGDNVLVCVSGGSDSMCLLHLLNQVSGKFKVNVSAVHYNHCLRDSESEEDEAFVSDYCNKMGIKLYIGRGDVSVEAAKRHAGIEETAREMRYDFFSDIAEKNGFNKIATAHNADDNLETVLLRISRGTGLSGLCGIPPVRDKIIRPLLNLTRSEIEEYLAANNIPHREDSSNFSDYYARNKIRHYVVPVLKQINTGSSISSVKMSDQLRIDDKFLNDLAIQFLNKNMNGNSLSASALLSAPRPVSTRAIRHICGSGLSYDHIYSVLALASGGPSDRLSLPGMEIHREYDQLVFSGCENITFSPVILPIGGSVFIENIGLVFTCKPAILTGTIHKSFTSFLFKTESICGKITVRPRISGDSIILSSKSGTKSLKKLFIEKKIPAYKRSAVPVIADEAGPIAIPGIGCSIRVTPSNGDNILRITCEEKKNNEFNGK